MSTHSSIVGGSTAARVMACPGSVVANLNLPKSIAISSEYAEEGTHYHDVMAALLNYRLVDNGADLEELAAEWLGRKFHDRVLTQQRIDEGVTPALAALAELEAKHGGGFWVVAIEKRVKFPGLPGCFGTIDLILRNRTTVLHVDWKFGQGVPVFATYPIDENFEKVNEQLMFYTVASMYSLADRYGLGDRLVVAIIQPRVEVKYSDAVLDPREPDDFQEKLTEAVVTALSPDPPRNKGEYCRWAACKLTCPLWQGPLLDATAFKMPTKSTVMGDDLYGQHLANAKRVLDLVAVLKTEVDNQMHVYLSNGGSIPGWRLKAKAKHRVWVDEKIVDKALRKLGMKPGEIWRKKLLTFEAADAWAKRKRTKIPDHLRLAPPTSDTTIASVDDPAPVVEPSLAIEQFRASFAKLAGPTALLGTTKKD